MKNKITRKIRKAFTLIEMIVVVIIIGVLMSVVGPKLAEAINKTKLNAAGQNLESFNKDLSSFIMKEADVDAGWKNDSGTLYKNSGSLVFYTSAEDAIVKSSDYLGSIKLGETNLGDTLKRYIGDKILANYIVSSEAPSITNITLGNNKYYIVVKTDGNNKIQRQVMIYCQKTDAYHGIDTYEEMWNKAIKSGENIKNLKPDDNSKYSCLVKNMPVSN